MQSKTLSRNYLRNIIFGCLLTGFFSPTLRADLIEDIEDIESTKSTPPVVTESPAAPSDQVSDSVQNQKAPPPAPANPSGDTKSENPPSTPPNSNSKSDKREPVYFESNGLQGQRSQGVINLLEKVLVTQGDLRIEADKAAVHFDQKTEEVSRVVATGNVKIFRVDPDTQQKVRAESNEVLFDNMQRKVTLKGNARLWRGPDLVRGKQITYELDSGWIKADRVEGIVQPGEADGQSKTGVSKSKNAPTKAPAGAKAPVVKGNQK